MRIAFNAIPTNIGNNLSSFAWDLRYLLLGRHFGVPTDVVKHIGTPASLLDVGCGRGLLLQTLRSHGWDGTYEGFDASRYVIGQARKINDPKARWAVDTFERFDPGNRKWDTIVIAEVIYYIVLADVRRQIFRYRDMLSPTGRLLVRIHDFRKFNQYVHETVGAGARQVSSALMVVGASAEEQGIWRVLGD
jgi:2-polyprenyl-3-methyl-5-hydroxy-6-metoxy-1,4-benzoquinol methylase